MIKMSLTDGNGGLSAADVAAVTGNNGFGFGGDGAWWLLVLFLFALSGNGWGNNFGGNGGYAADMQRGFDQSALMNGLNGINANINAMGMSQQNCCCDNRVALADLKYTVATENCADRTAFNEGVRDIIASQTSSTQAILDKLCQLELDGLKERNAQLTADNTALKFAQSQTAQTAQILANNAAQTQALEQFLNPTPIPAYVVQNPNCCGQNLYSGCGCGA